MRRLSLICSHRPPCPGCPRFALPGVAANALAAAAGLAERAGLPSPIVHEGPLLGFRHRARLAVRGRMENPKIGIFEEGTHRVVHIPNCGVHHPLINHVVREVRRCLVEHQIAPYSELAHLGCIRALQIVVERASESAQLVVVTRDEDLKLEALFASIQARLGHQLHSLWWNTNPDRTNTVLGSHFEKISGPDTTLELLEGVEVHYPPGAFGQSNLPLFAELARRARSFIPDDARVLELYAGTGALGLPLAHRTRSLEINEISAASLDGLIRGIEALGPEARSRISVHPGPAAALASRVAHADLVLVDPPRKGLDPELLDALLSSPPERFVYVSCSLSTFLAEAERLLASKAMKLVNLELFALFPFTEHVETLAVFDRLRARPGILEPIVHS